MDTDSSTMCIKTESIYVDIAKDVETTFDTSYYGLERKILSRKETKKFLDWRKMSLRVC